LGFLETGSEKAWSGSGGGFSTMFSQPSWQASQVANYLSANAKSLPPSSYWNATGRAYPDVSAFSVGFAVVVDLVPTPVDGTSCATPTFSGVIALINDLKLNAGKPPLGPLNQWLYGLRAGTNDIVEGCNQGCLGQHGFCAAKGWDPVTGLGSPLYNKMKQQI
jgi:tripeptidyl-peptidase-1